MKLLLILVIGLITVSCKSTTTCETLGLQTDYAHLSVEKTNDNIKEVVRYRCSPKFKGIR
jgi:hypothetical protein